jgi:catechol 2,3-dioxygenase-like lactoylglutathione lyase family enzyme
MADSLELGGICQVKVPVTDLARSARWYAALLDLRLVREFVEDDRVVGAVLAPREGRYVISVRLRDYIPGHPQMPGFDLFSLRVADVEALRAVERRCEDLGVTHCEVVDRGSDGYHLDVTDPDGTNIRFVTHGAEDAPDFVGVVFAGDGPPTFYSSPRLPM